MKVSAIAKKRAQGKRISGLSLLTKKSKAELLTLTAKTSAYLQQTQPQFEENLLRARRHLKSEVTGVLAGPVTRR